jgi:hypothetical protein
MNEMDQLTRFRATVPPGVSPRAEELFRARLQRELDAGRPRLGHDDDSPARAGHRRRMMLIGGAAGVVTTAAAVAVALVAAPSGSPSPAGPSAARPPAASPTRPATGHTSSPTAGSQLMRLAAYIATTPRQPGDATLVAQTTTLPPGDPQAGTYRVFDLFTDGGPYYFGQTKNALAAQVAAHHTTAGAEFADDVAAARYALHGDLATARVRMAALSSSPTHGMDDAEVKFKAEQLHLKPAPGQSLRDAVGKVMTDNYVWENSQDALVAGAGDPQIRAGVLRLLTTVSGITVTTGTAAGQPTLVVAQVAPLETVAPGHQNQRYQEALTINARTGIPIGFTGGIIGQRPGTTVSYQISRVTLAAVAAGRF